MTGFGRDALDLQTQFRAEQRLAFSVPVRAHSFVPKNTIIAIDPAVFKSVRDPEPPARPQSSFELYVPDQYTILRMQHGGSHPLFSRHTLGAKEAERDGRRHA